MKKYIFYVFTALIVSLTLYQGCDPAKGVDYPPGIVYGIVYDSSTHLPLDSAYVISIPSGNACYTDTGGRYRITNIQMPSSGLNATIIATKKNYDSDTSSIWLISNDSISVRLVLAPNHGIYSKDNLVLQQYSNQQSNSSLDLVQFVVVPGQADFRDLDLRDSMGLGQRFQLKSANNDPIHFSLDTKFAGSLGNFSKYDFDTLQMIYGLGGPIFDSYFQYSQTQFFSNPLTENSVYPFYLSGRYNINPALSKIYGLLYINSIWYDAGSNTTYVRIDIKENRNGENIFVIH
jgi:hypothetical protein